MIRICLPALAVVALAAACAGPAHRPARAQAGACGDRPLDSAALVRVATDTIARLRRAPQRVEQIVASQQRYVVWTEDTSSQTIHDGGRVGFDCSGRVRLIWLDGG